MTGGSKQQEFTALSFLHDGDVCVMMPEDSGFEPDEDVVIIKTGEAIHIVHAWDKDAIERLTAVQGEHEAAIVDDDQ